MREPSGVEICEITRENSRLLDRVDDDVFDEPVRAEYLNRFLANPANHLLVALVDGEVIGMVSAFTYSHPDKPLQLFINEVGVSARFHRRGIGTQLIQAMLELGKSRGYKEAWVATEVSNGAAQSLYRRCGGQEDEEHAVVYTWRLMG